MGVQLYVYKNAGAPPLTAHAQKHLHTNKDLLINKCIRRCPSVNRGEDSSGSLGQFRDEICPVHQLLPRGRYPSNTTDKSLHEVIRPILQCRVILITA